MATGVASPTSSSASSGRRRLGAWSYEAWDTKLARQTKPYFVLQLCFYTEQTRAHCRA